MGITNPFESIYTAYATRTKRKSNYAYQFIGIGKDFTYPHGWDWDNSFVQKEIQYWEQFYISWLRKEKDILVMYPDNFDSGLAENSLKKIANFMNFVWHEQRVKCSLKCNHEKFHRRQTPYEKGHIENKSKLFIASKLNTCGPNTTYTWNLYKRKHFIWINSAIRNVKHELKKRSLDFSHISDYKIKNWRIYVCPEHWQEKYPSC